MARVTRRHRGDHAMWERLIAPRDDWLVAETVDGRRGDDEVAFRLVDGPFTEWRRSVERSHGNATEFIETHDFRLDVPFLAPFFSLFVRWSLARDQRDDPPFWAPPQRFDARGARVFGLLVIASLAAAYLGTLLSQTISFVADDFGTSDATKGLVLALTRIGALLALIVVWLADRSGRRRLFLIAGSGATAFAVLAALSPNIWLFGAAELVSRGFATGFALLIGILAAEEAPAGARAWATAILALFAGLGSGIVLWFLPIADSGEGRWRVLFLLSLFLLPVLFALARRLTESRRFDAFASGDEEPTKAPITSRMRRRFGLLAIVSFAGSMFGAPSSNFQVDYLRDVRGFSGTEVSLFSTVTSTPVGIGVAIFGPMADRRGRRLIGAIGLVAGVVFNVVRYGFGGPLMWIGGTLSTVIGAATIPALGVYGPELFPTSRRGLANGLLTCVAVIGSSVGLIFVGLMLDRWSYGLTFAVLAIVPLLATVAIRWFPETAQVELEAINPEDAEPSPDLR